MEDPQRETAMNLKCSTLIDGPRLLLTSVRHLAYSLSFILRYVGMEQVGERGRGHATSKIQLRFDWVSSRPSYISKSWLAASMSSAIRRYELGSKY